MARNPARGLHTGDRENHCEVVRTGHKFQIMRTYFSPERLWLVAAVAVLTTGCQQTDQQLPFEIAEGEGATLSIGPTGGTLSVPPSFSLDFPAGALTGATSVSATPLITEPFPQDAGVPVPGTAFAVGPVGTTLGEPARVEMAVDPSLLEAGEEVLLTVAVRRATGEIATFESTYDVTNGVLVAEVDELGPMAAVVSLDAIAVSLGSPPALIGGTFPPPAPLTPVGPAPAPGTLVFEADCSPEGRPCFTSGLIRIWADDVVVERMGDKLFLVDPSVRIILDFISFDQSGLPTEVVGAVSVGGDLRARFNSTVTGYDLEEGITTGPGVGAAPTTVNVAGSVMTIGQTTSSSGEVEFNEDVEFSIVGIGTTQMMIAEIEAEVEFENDEGPPSYGYVTAHIRLRVPES